MRPILAALLALAPALLAPAFAPRAAHAQALDLTHGGPVEVTASEGMDWLQNEQQIVARGNARAVRGNVTVTADRLIAYYRKKPPQPGKAPPAAAPAADAGAAAGAGGPAQTVADDTGGSEIYRIEAVGHVHIFTPTDHAWGDRAIYDIDQAVLVMTGGALKLTTPQHTMTARDDMEYWSQKHMAVARGNAVVTTSDGRRISADTLVGYTAEDEPRRAAKPAAAGKPDDLANSGKLKKVEAFGSVDLRTATETVHADRGVYVPDSGIARLVGHVRITRGQNQVNGTAADVNLKTGISTLLSGPQEPVAGLIMPKEAEGAGKPRAGAPR